MTAPTQAPRLGRSTALMASGTAVSRVLGLVRTAVLVAALGQEGSAADSFAAANKLPTIMYLLIVGGALNAVLVPQVVRAYRRPDGQVYVDRLLTVGIVGLAGLAVLLTVLAPVLTYGYTDFADPAVTRLTILLAYWCLPQLFFYGLYALLGQILNARGSFGPFMWAPVLNSAVSIVGLGIFVAVHGAASDHPAELADPAWWHLSEIVLLAGTATLGIVAQALVLVVPLYRSGFRYRPRWGLRGSGLGSAGKVATWTFLGLVVGQVGVLVVSRVTSAASGQGAGNFAYDNAFLLFMLPHSLVTVSLMTALFTRLSAKAAAGDVDGVRADLSLGLRTVGLFTVGATTVLAVLAYPIARLLFNLDAGAASSLAAVVVAMVLGLVAFGAWSMCQRVYYAYEDARSMVPIQVVMVGVVVAGTLLGRFTLPASSWTAGAGAAMSVSYVVGAGFALGSVRRRLGGIDGRRVVVTHVKAGASAAVAAGLGMLAVQLLGPVESMVEGLVTCLVAGAVMAGAYTGVLVALRADELRTLMRSVIRR